MAFVYIQEVRFRHCDPAGIVFYPRFFEMINDTVESFFAQRLDYPFSQMHRDAGIPTARIETVFKAPSRLGDRLEITLRCLRIGRTSLDLDYRATCDGEERFSASSTVVHVGADGRPQPWSDAVRELLEQELEGEAHGT